MNKKEFFFLHGFSLIQTIIFLAILSVIATLSIPKLSYFKDHSVLYEMEKMRLLIFFLQDTSCMTGIERRLVFNQTDNSYYSEGIREKLSPSLIFGIQPTIYGPPCKPQKSVTKPITYADNTLICYPDGTISSGTIYITDTERNLCYALTISVDEHNLIRIYRYNKSWNLIS